MGRLPVALVAAGALTGLVIVGTPAEAISCVGAGDVTLLGPAGCTQRGLTFTDFSVAVAGFSAGIGQDVNLNFQLAHEPIREVACGEAFVNGVCGTPPLADLVAVANATAAPNFDPDSMVFIRNDIQFPNNSSIREFTQSRDTTGLPPVPEPATLVLLGSTLAGIGMASRRKLRNKHPQTSA